ncbi:pyridoxal-phosphate dependent enzyme [Paracrocinitomix mangrovi]|uniref:pyridoxal-phosphate dependent enzyme n=1 Tax=Paracrocinitomix mangrovi TaxID=2862509 RepID=UPI001C8E9645|nr:pyridoxal-phosphate dependent enzyme [Paracrocinitomix mangrovi]UKN02559.1 pyridoxal-phosphate dependent enzyme [Paracrocinitomix mangrovi]
MTKSSYLALHEKIKPYIHWTPVLTSGLVNDVANCQLFLKCENFQKMGAFKMRGAANAILQLSDSEKAKGVVTHSSGNFAQALSLAAKAQGVKAYIVMPTSAPKVKVEAVKGYGGEVIMCPPTLKDREEAANKIQKEKGATFIHPSNDDDVIHGQGTATIELLNDHPDLDAIITPVGGGGLLAGTALAASIFAPNCKVYAGEPENVNDAYRSFLSGEIEDNEASNTVADGLKTQLGDRNFPLIKEHVESIITVSEDEIIEAMKLIWSRMKIVIEPSSAVAVAAVIKRKDLFKNQKVGVIVSGGNVDFDNLPF